MEVADHISSLDQEGKLLADAAGRAGLAAKVPSCPDWSVRDLVRHTSGVHRWATRHVAEARADLIEVDDLEELVGEWPADSHLIDWFVDGHQNLVRALSDAPADLSCFTFLPAPSPLAFWARRQAHETAIHRVDAELAGGPVTPFDPMFAADGIDELLAGFLARPGGRLRSEQRQVLAFVADDAAATWTMVIDADGRNVEPGQPADRATDCTISADASTLYQWLWNRADAGAVDVSGDRAVVDRWRESVNVRWS